MATYNPRFTFYHPNMKGTGSALQMSVYPATAEDNGGRIACRICGQKTVGDRNATSPIFPTFDWDNAAAFDLDVAAVSLILQVLRGETESVNDGRGIFQRDGEKYRLVRFNHKIEPVPGYLLEVVEKDDAGEGKERKWPIFFSPAEGLALSEAFGGAMVRLMFG